MHKASLLNVFFLFLVCFAWVPQAFAADQPAQTPLHIYSSRHYDVDQKLYSRFTEKTGIPIKLVESKDDALQARLEAEGAQSEADVLVTVDAGRLWRAEESGLLEPVSSEILKARIPENLRDPRGTWYGFSTRARAITYNKTKVNPAEITSYADLTHPKWKGRICVRSGSNIYNLSLLASMISLQGAEAAENWAKGLLANLARKPDGGDRDQVKAIAAGECDIAVGNTYYIGQMLNDPEQKAAAESVRIVFPTFDGDGTHLNVSGVAMTKAAPNRENALKFMEWLASDEAQRIYAETNHEYPVKPGVARSELVQGWGEFTADSIPLTDLANLRPAALKLIEEVNFDG
jgi:iron(III) transport system substrate-binding protein